MSVTQTAGGNTPAPAINGSGNALTDKAVCLDVRISRLGNARKVRASELEIGVDVDPAALRVNKELLQSEELAAIKTLDGEIRGWLYSVSLPSPMKAGVYLLPIVSIERAEEYLRDASEKRARLVDKFVDAYPALIEEAALRLRAVFQQRDYASPDAVLRAFSLSWRYISFGVPEALKSVNPSIFAQEREKCARMWQEATEEVQQALRASMADLVSSMVDKLSGGRDGGKPKIFRDTLVSNLAEFLREFDARNLTDDAQLAALVQQARDLLAGVDPDTLRKSADVRSSVADGFGKVKAQLDTMMEDRPRRSIEFEE